LIWSWFLLNIRVAPCISPMVFQLSSLILGTVFPLDQGLRNLSWQYVWKHIFILLTVLIQKWQITISCMQI
jgi:hypothetical protein